MEPQKLLTADYLDIIYDHRNKQYGGYELRTHYDRRLRKAVVFSLAGVASLLSFSFIAANKTGDHPVSPMTLPYVISHPITIVKPEIQPKIMPPAPATVHHIKTNVFTVPVINPDDIVPPDKQLTENKNLANAHPGVQTLDGDSTGIGTMPSDNKDNGTGVVQPDGGKPNEPMHWVQQMPQFSGDMNAYISKNIRYPESARSTGIAGGVAVEFVVNEDGTVSNAKVVRGIGGGCDEEALRIVNNMPKWKPGKQNGTAVKVFFVLPIKFELN